MSEHYTKVFNADDTSLITQFLKGCQEAGAEGLEYPAWLNKKRISDEGVAFAVCHPIIEISFRTKFGDADKAALLFEAFIKDAKAQKLYTPEWYPKMELSFSCTKAFVAEKPDRMKFSIRLEQTDASIKRIGVAS